MQLPTPGLNPPLLQFYMNETRIARVHEREARLVFNDRYNCSSNVFYSNSGQQYPALNVSQAILWVLED